jgi:hypothetical protein
MNDKLEDLINRLRTMKSVLGLSRTEKETLEEAAEIIEAFNNLLKGE